jgi:hypothetical protein
MLRFGSWHRDCRLPRLRVVDCASQLAERTRLPCASRCARASAVVHRFANDVPTSGFAWFPSSTSQLRLSFVIGALPTNIVTAHSIVGRVARTLVPARIAWFTSTTDVVGSILPLTSMTLVFLAFVVGHATCCVSILLSLPSETESVLESHAGTAVRRQKTPGQSFVLCQTLILAPSACPRVCGSRVTQSEYAGPGANNGTPGGWRP